MKELKRKERKKFDKEIVNKVESKLFSNTEKFNNLDIHLNKDNVYVPFSDKALINDEIFNYIDRLYRINLIEEDLSLNFVFDDDISENEQKEIIDKIKQEYEFKFSSKKMEIRRVNLKSLLLLIIGLVLLSLYVILSVVLNYQFSEMISIFSWVFIWESVDFFVFENSKNRRELIKLRHLNRAKFNIKRKEK